MYEINMEKNIRELLRNTIFAHPDDIKSDELKKTSKAKKKGQ
jgi:spore coat protein CotF